MVAKDTYHDNFVRSLQKDGWTITDDPLTIPYKGTEVLVDIGAERLLAAERDGKRIAVEVTSFIKSSVLQDLKRGIMAIFHV